MQKIIIRLDFSNGPVWKKVDAKTGEWKTGIGIIDNDKAIRLLDEEASMEYVSLYSFGKFGQFEFDEKQFELKKTDILSLIRTLILRLEDLNDGTYEVVDEATEILLSTEKEER